MRESDLGIETSQREQIYTFDALLDEIRNALHVQLSTEFQQRRDAAAPFGKAAWKPLDAAAELALRGGKRLRAALMAATYGACGGPGGPLAILHAASAVEILHTYLLIHDDWIDGDELRRGGPSVHTGLRAHFGDVQVGDSMALLVGDYLAAMAQELFLATPLAPARVLAAASIFARVHQDVVVGQMLDVRRGPVNAEDVYDLKTGSYTVRGPVAIGAAFAGVSPALATLLDSYARPLGVAFQLRDDLLSTFGDSKLTGKPVANDLRRGKRTSLIRELEGEPHAQALLARAVGNPDATDHDIESLTELMITSGARSRAEASIARLAQAARRALLEACPLLIDGTALLGAIEAIADRDN